MDERIKIEKKNDENICAQLADLSLLWEKENSCAGYVANTPDSLKDFDIFTYWLDDKIIGYLYGKKKIASHIGSAIPDGTTYFYVEEIYVFPEYRSQGIGEKLLAFLEKDLKQSKIEYYLLTTATKDYQKILHFYIQKNNMTFWSSTLFKKI